MHIYTHWLNIFIYRNSWILEIALFPHATANLLALINFKFDAELS